jgi:hypothetical protein
LPAVVVTDRKVLPIPLLPMALQPALWDGPYKGALAGVVEMFWGSMFKAACRIGVGGEATHGIVVLGMLGMRARVPITCWSV